MALVTCGGADVMRGRIHLPLRGVWWAELALDVATEPTGSVTIAASSGLSLAGTVVNGGVFLDTAMVRVVGGAGGLGKLVPPAAYQSAALRDPLSAVLSACGETLSGAVSSTVTSAVLTYWVLTQGHGAGAIDALCNAAGSGINWRLLGDGTVWLGTETWPSSSLPQGADVLHYYPEEGRYLLGVEEPALLPGVNLSDVGANIGAVDHWIAPDEIRSWAWRA